MSFDAAACLRKATSRAKSDVANKLVSMFLHEVSRKAVAELGLSVVDPRYANQVISAFGEKCAYCSRVLEKDRVAVEHLDGMNRLRAGLHIPGNVVLACKLCNNEKRRDDSIIQLSLGDHGWQSFLSHDSKSCVSHCKTCFYWKRLWTEESECSNQLAAAKQRILAFRDAYSNYSSWIQAARPTIKASLDALYRECQDFAARRIKESADILFIQLESMNTIALEARPVPPSRPVCGTMLPD